MVCSASLACSSGKPVRDLPGEQALPFGGFEQLQRPMNMARFEAPRSDHLQLLPRNRVRIEGNVPGVSILAENQVLAAVAAIVQAFIDSLGMADTLNNDVCAITAGFFEYPRSPLSGPAPLLFDVSPRRTARELQPVRRARRSRRSSSAPAIFGPTASAASRRDRRPESTTYRPTAPARAPAMNRCCERATCADYCLGRKRSGIRKSDVPARNSIFSAYPPRRCGGSSALYEIP